MSITGMFGIGWIGVPPGPSVMPLAPPPEPAGGEMTTGILPGGGIATGGTDDGGGITLTGGGTLGGGMYMGPDPGYTVVAGGGGGTLGGGLDCVASRPSFQITGPPGPIATRPSAPCAIAAIVRSRLRVIWFTWDCRMRRARDTLSAAAIAPTPRVRHISGALRDARHHHDGGGHRVPGCSTPVPSPSSTGGRSRSPARPRPPSAAVAAS